MFILRVKGRCKNCGSNVEESKSDVIHHELFDAARNDFNINRDYFNFKMLNHECSEFESGVVETLSYKLG